MTANRPNALNARYAICKFIASQHRLHVSVPTAVVAEGRPGRTAFQVIVYDVLVPDAIGLLSSKQQPRNMYQFVYSRTGVPASCFQNGYRRPRPPGQRWPRSPILDQAASRGYFPPAQAARKQRAWRQKVQVSA